MDIDQQVEVEIKRLDEANIFQNPQLCREVYKNELARNISYQQLEKLDMEKVAMQSEYEGKIKIQQTDLAKCINEKVALQYELKDLQSQLANSNDEKVAMQFEIKNLQSQLAKRNDVLSKAMRDLMETSVCDNCEIPQVYTERNSARPNEPPSQPPIPDHRRTRTVSTNTNTTDLPQGYPFAMIIREPRSSTLPSMPSRALLRGPEPSLGNHHRRLQPEHDLIAPFSPRSSTDDDFSVSSFNI